jgi:hypothetical protein
MNCFKVLSSEMDLAEVLSLERLSLNGEAPRLSRSPSCERPLKMLCHGTVCHLVQLLAIGNVIANSAHNLRIFFCKNVCTGALNLFGNYYQWLSKVFQSVSDQ